MPRLDNTNSALTEQIWQQFQAQNPGASWADFRAAFPINAEVTQQATPQGTQWIPVPSQFQSGMLTDQQLNPLNPNFEGSQYSRVAGQDDQWYAGNYAAYLQAQNGAQAGFNEALQGVLTPEEWEALQMVQLGNHSWFPGGGPITYGMSSIDPREYLQQKFGTWDINQIAQAKGVPLMPTLDQGNQQAKPYNDYLESLKTLRSQIPTPTPSFPTASPISSGTVMQAPMMTPQSPLTTNQPQITYPTVGDSSAWQAQNAVQTPMQQRMNANGMLYS